MFNQRPDEVQVALDSVIVDALENLKYHGITEDEYATTKKNVVELFKIRDSQKSKTLDPNVVLTVAANVFGILAILNYERANVITSKALGFVLKLR